MRNQMMKAVTMILLAVAALSLGACAKDKCSSTSRVDYTYSK